VVKASRESLERELLWNIALDDDPARRERLYHMLVPAANDQLSMVSAAEDPLPLGNGENHE
jgi:hypothetical protein